MKAKLQVPGGLFTALLLFNTASAQSVLSYFASTPAVSAPSGSFTNWTKTLQLPAFDPTLGTLTQVKLTFTGEVLQTAQGENLGAAPAPYNYDVTTTLTLAKGLGPTLFAPAPIAFTGFGTNAPFDGTIDFFGTSAFSFTQTLATTEIVTDSSAPILFSYTGLGMIDFTATATATSFVTGSGQFVSQTISKASASLGVEYTFSPIPEPAGYAVVLGLAILAGAVLRRRSAPGAKVPQM